MLVTELTGKNQMEQVYKSATHIYTKTLTSQEYEIFRSIFRRYKDKQHESEQTYYNMQLKYENINKPIL